MIQRRSHQQGYFLFIAVIFIFAIGALGTMIAYIFSNRVALSVPQQNAMKVFYNAESGLEIGARLLTHPNLSGTPSRVSCAALTGTGAVTNASLNGGTFTLSTINSSPVFAADTLSASETASDATINVSSTSGFAPTGRVIIDKEAIDYAGISGNTFVNVTRGVDNTTASSHASGAGVSQYQCSVAVDAGIPSAASPVYERELQENVQLQDGWAVGAVSGNNFIFTRWNYPTEKAWNAGSLLDASFKVNLNGVAMLSSADGWAVGNMSGTNYVFLRWNGSAWTRSTVAGVCSGQNLLGISMVSASEGWAVGVRQTNTCSGTSYRYNILKWNGSTWTKLAPTTIPADNSSNQNLNAVSVIDTAGDGTGNIGFAVGNSGRILKYNGTSWTADTSPVSNNLTGVWTVSASEAWAVGASGRILKWNGSTWSTFTTPTSTQLNEVKMYDGNKDGVAEFGVAAGNSGVILTYNGSSWSTTDIGATNFLGVGVANESDAWVVGASGVAYHWNGSSWTSVTTGTSVQLNSMSMIAPKSTAVSNWKQVFR